MPVCFSLSYGLVKSTIYIRSYEKWGVCSAIKQKKTKHLGKSLKLLWRNNMLSQNSWCFACNNYCGKSNSFLQKMHTGGWACSGAGPTGRKAALGINSLFNSKRKGWVFIGMAVSIFILGIYGVFLYSFTLFGFGEICCWLRGECCSFIGNCNPALLCSTSLFGGFYFHFISRNYCTRKLYMWRPRISDPVVLLTNNKVMIPSK